jgi:hypothetical protein
MLAAKTKDEILASGGGDQVIVTTIEGPGFLLVFAGPKAKNPRALVPTVVSAYRAGGSGYAEWFVNKSLFASLSSFSSPEVTVREGKDGFSARVVDHSDDAFDLTLRFRADGSDFRLIGSTTAVSPRLDGGVGSERLPGRWPCREDVNWLTGECTATGRRRMRIERRGSRCRRAA